MKQNFCVWIDHNEARVFGITSSDVDRTAIEDDRPKHRIHRKADHVGLGKETMSPQFLGEVAEALQPAKAILIGGPGQTRTVLAGYLNDKYPALAKRIWAIEPMDHPSDGEVVAAARKYFQAATRMHQ
ncbi:MAG: translational machinery protein [Devosia sp.]